MKEHNESEHVVHIQTSHCAGGLVVRAAGQTVVLSMSVLAGRAWQKKPERKKEDRDKI